MEPLARQTRSPGQGGIRPVGLIAHAGVPDRRHVHSDLVSAPGLQMDLRQAGTRHGLHDVVVGDRLASAVDDRHLPLAPRVPTNGGVDRTR